MLEDIFVTDNVINTPKSDVDLSEDPNAWPIEIQNYVMAAIPVLAEAPGQLVMDAVDQQKKYAKGSYIVDANGEMVAFPIIVKAGKLQPIDVFIYKNKWYPVDMDDISSVISSSQIGTGLMKEEDIPIGADGSNMGVSMAPGQYGSGMITNITRKMSSLNPKMTETIISTLKECKGALKKLASNENLHRYFVNALETPYSEKTASESCANPMKNTDSVIVSIGSGEFNVTSSNGSFVKIAGNKLAEFLVDAELDHSKILKDLLTTKIAMTWDDDKVATEKLGSVKDGMSYFSCYRAGDLKPVDTFVLGVVKTAGKKEYVCVNSDNTYSKQDSILGEKLAFSSEFEAEGPSTAEDVKSGDKIVIPIPDVEAGPDDPVSLLDPVSVESTNVQPDAKVIDGKSDNGTKITIIVTSDSAETPVKAAHIPENILVRDKTANCWYVPAKWPVFKIASKNESLIKDKKDFAFNTMMHHQLSSQKFAARKLPVLENVRIWKTAPNSNAVKVGAANPKIMTDAETMLLIRKSQGGGVMDAMAKIASGMVKSIDVMTHTPSILLNDGSTGRDLAKNTVWDPKKDRSKGLEPIPADPKKTAAFVRVAASLENEEDVDTVLALNYVTPDNLMEFKNSIPDMKKTEDTLAKLLISARLGNKAVDENDVKRTLESLHTIIKEVDGSF